MKKNIFLILIIIFSILIIFPFTVNASQIDPDDYKSDGPGTDDTKELFIFGGSIAGIIQFVGTIVSVGTLMVIGIRYMLASADEKAEYKERLLPYLIGAILLFGASTVVGIVYNMFH